MSVSARHVIARWPLNMMNPSFLIRLLCMVWLGAGLPLFADEPLPDVSQISLEDARRELADMDTIQRRDFCEAAFKAERIDLLDLCMVTPSGAGYIHYYMSKMPDSPFRRELILWWLRTPLRRWPDNPLDIRVDMERRGAVDSITEYVGAYLPDTPITWEVIGSPERRLQLADAFEAAVARVHAENPGAARDRTKPRPTAGAPLSVPSATRRAAAHEANPASAGAYASLWLAGALLLAAAAVWYYKYRTGRRSSQQP